MDLCGNNDVVKQEREREGGKESISGIEHRRTGLKVIQGLGCLPLAGNLVMDCACLQTRVSWKDTLGKEHFGLRGILRYGHVT